MDEADSNVGGPASLNSAFVESKLQRGSSVIDEKRTNAEAEDAVIAKMNERHDQFYSGMKREISFYDGREKRQEKILLAVEDIQKIQAHVDVLRQKVGQPILVDFEITLADLANIGILLGSEVGLFLKDRLLYLATSGEPTGIKPPSGDYKFVAHSHPTFSDEEEQITTDKSAASLQLEIAINAKYTVMIYSKGQCYNMTDKAHGNVSSMVNSRKTGMNNQRIYFREPLQVNILAKLGQDPKASEKLEPIPTGTDVTPDFFDLIFGEDMKDVFKEKSGEDEASNSNASEIAQGEIKPARKNSNSGFYYMGYVPGTVQESRPNHELLEKYRKFKAAETQADDSQNKNSSRLKK